MGVTSIKVSVQNLSVLIFIVAPLYVVVNKFGNRMLGQAAT